ncbi:TetR/AcrR family transcriptional regulator [Actinophytocola sp.]|uniref:TetR/AcrR family transcriptional regulator n=1 Tax=Actinophytocola sp. TaxID=1872138 RepID=UPI003D6A8442
MPRLWNNTIDAHRRAVRDAALDATGALVAEHGLRAVTMSRVAEHTGIGRATLYKYFPDSEAILVAWHERQVTRNLDLLAEVRDRAADPREGLEAVLTTYARHLHRIRAHHGSELAAMLHRHDHVGHASKLLHDLVRDLLAEGARRDDVRDDVSPGELTNFCLHALTGATAATSLKAVDRLVAVTMSALLASR